MTDTTTTITGSTAAPLSTSATSGYTPQTWEREPRAVILVEPAEVQLGDVLVDVFGGQLSVDESVRRRHEPGYEFAAFKRRTDFREPLVTDRRRVVDRAGGLLLRVARPVDQFGPVAGHHSRVRSHNPVRRGCYTLVGGWRAECSCGWPGEQPQIHGGQGHARQAWRTHKADVITQQGRDGHAGYRHVSTSEQEHRLPPVPWSFVTHNGLALASLGKLPLREARQTAAAWAGAFGVQVDEHRTVHHDITVLHIEVPRPGATSRVDPKLVVIQGYFPDDREARAA